MSTAHTLSTPCGPVSYSVSGPTEAGGTEVGPGRDLVLVHGWCCDSSTMAPVRERLVRRHRVLSIDLRGHGASLEWDDDGAAGAGWGRRLDQDQVLPAGLSAVTIDHYAADLRQACHDAGLRAPVVIGHSMGALVAVAAAAGPRAGHSPGGLVLLDPAPLTSARAAGFWLRAAEQSARDLDGRWRRSFAEGMFPEHGAAGRYRDHARVVDLMAGTPAAVAAGAARAMARFDGLGGLRQLSVPVLRIDAEEPEAVLDEIPQHVSWTDGRVVGAGHFAQLEVPEQVEAMVARWLTVTGLQGY
ncbi:alpha/beta fold hydrolase [Ornithinicoccus halotolerans]|uniref:alpha/beta fold hydrolase n=1 Tax=Ornithinicoccus halotolerans TaxID=1748220 RepID=UPI001298043E|nr:alpha/beta hydrolase [Ornithinicoccus halotolerans]